MWKSIPENVQKEILEEIPPSGSADDVMACPAGVDPTVFRQLPPDIRQELRDRNKTKETASAKVKKNNTIKNYFSVK